MKKVDLPHDNISGEQLEKVRQFLMLRVAQKFVCLEV